MKKVKIEHSNFTKSLKLSYSKNDAMQYLYFNGKVPLNCSQVTFLEFNNRQTTICNHIRIIHALTWFKSETLLDCILYAISDSKYCVDTLRNKKNDPHFDIGWWRATHRKVFNKEDTKDEFYTSNIFRKKSKFFNESTQIISHNIINENEENSPPIYKTYYKKMLNEILNIEDKQLASKLREIVLTCVYMRYRIDQRIIYHEKNLYSGNLLRLFYNRYLVVFIKKKIEKLYRLLSVIKNYLKKIFF